MNHQDHTRWLSPLAAAERLGYPATDQGRRAFRSLLARLEREGKGIPVYRLAGRLVRFDQVDIDALVQRQRSAAATDEGLAEMERHAIEFARTGRRLRISA